jgi:hypothetical protein
MSLCLTALAAQRHSVMFEIGNFGCFQAFNVCNNKISIIISDLVLKNDL